MWNCAGCGVEVYRPRPSSVVGANRFCSVKCAASARRKDPSALADPYSRRASRAPGPSSTFRNKLLKKWQREQRSCFYCTGPCESVDHVIPIARGGTHFEGNLVPCCRKCNGSKSDWLLIEWRLRRGNKQEAA
jgi:5-methylcytosine-specific restriction endonuclease McrA